MTPDGQDGHSERDTNAVSVLCVRWLLDPADAKRWSGPLLRPEASALVRTHISPQQATSGHDSENEERSAAGGGGAAVPMPRGAAGASGLGGSASEAAANTAGSTSSTAVDAEGPTQDQGPPPIAVYMGSGAKVPKWMKLGPK